MGIIETSTSGRPWTVRYSPETLFNGGRTGFYYAPWDLSTMFQDAAGTIPVTGADQPVGKIISLAGGTDQNLTADADSHRPTLRNSGSLWWLEFEHNSDYLLRNHLVNGMVQSFMIVGFKVNNINSSEAIPYSSILSNDHMVIYVLPDSSIGYYNNPDGTSPFFPGTENRVAAFNTFNYNDVDIYMDNPDNGYHGTIGAYFYNRPCMISTLYSWQSMDFRFYGGLSVYNATLSPYEISQVMRFFAEKSGVAI